MSREITWTQEEPGWYTSEIGGIVQERDGKWWFYPKSGGEASGPSETLGEAKAAVGPGMVVAGG